MKLLAAIGIVFLLLICLPCIVFGEPTPTMPIEPSPIPTETPVPMETPTPIPTPSPDPGLLDGITHLPDNIINKAIETYLSILNNFISGEVIFYINQLINAFYNFIKGGDPVFNDPTIDNIYTIVKPVSYTLMTLFFIIGMTKHAIYFEVTNWPVLIKSGLMLIAGKFVVDGGMTILKAICGLSTYLSTLIINSSNINITEIYNGLDKAYSDDVSKINVPAQAAGAQAIISIFSIIALLGVAAIFVVLILRQIHLGVLVCAAPLFLSTIVADVSNDIVKNYFKHFFATAFQTVFMTIAMAIFCGSIKSFLSGSSIGFGGGFVGMLIGLIGLSCYIVAVPNTIKSILGAGGGNGLSIAAIASLFTAI